MAEKLATSRDTFADTKRVKRQSRERDAQMALGSVCGHRGRILSLSLANFHPMGSGDCVRGRWNSADNLRVCRSKVEYAPACKFLVRALVSRKRD